MGELDCQYTALVSYVESLNAYQLDQGGSVMNLRKLTTFEYLRQSLLHAREHASSIRSAVAADFHGASRP